LYFLSTPGLALSGHELSGLFAVRRDRCTPLANKAYQLPSLNGRLEAGEFSQLQRI
jgi:hypothetical protein